MTTLHLVIEHPDGGWWATEDGKPHPYVLLDGDQVYEAGTLDVILVPSQTSAFCSDAVWLRRP